MQNIVGDTEALLNQPLSRSWAWLHNFWQANIYLSFSVQTSEIMMGEGNRVAGVTLLTFTKMPGPHADTAWAVIG